MSFEHRDRMLEGIGWKARGDRIPEFPNPRPFFPRLKHSIKLIPLFVRVALHTFVEWWNGREAFIDIFNVFRHFTYTGVPLGGIGCGSIGTDFRGGFNRFSIIPGIKEQTETQKCNQFIVTVHSKKTFELIYQSILSCAEFPATVLPKWDTTIPAEDVRYRGLFPRAWQEFRLGSSGVTVVVEHLSPVIPGDYSDSSLPLANFEFHVFNDSYEEVEVSITMSFRNGTGNRKWNDENLCQSQKIQKDTMVVRTLAHTVKGMPVTYAIGTEEKNGSKVTTCLFDPNGTGGRLWSDLEAYGHLSSYDHLPSKPKELGIAVCSSFFVPPDGAHNTQFSLTWYMPQVHFGTAERFYNRRYCRFFNGPDADEVTAAICRHGLQNFSTWQKKIEDWQAPVLNDQKLPEWYKSAIFNELYYIVDGSTVWFEYDPDWKTEESLMSEQTEKQFKEYGRFGYMESWEYFMINTYDVHFYSSWAILKNWPQIEMSMQLDFADQMDRVDNNIATSLADGEQMTIKSVDRIPHDMGHPMADPWIHTNAYILHDTGRWKDLNLKFVISCYRDWKLIELGSEKGQVLEFFLGKCTKIVDGALECWDKDNDGMIENDGFADQTYDVWKMTGTSAYCGSLWIAALSSYIEMLKQSGLPTKHYEEKLEMAYDAYIGKLWNGTFFKFDELPENSKIVMADQLCGFWAMTAMDEPVQISKDKMKSALDTIFKYNVQMYNNGRCGAVNGYLTSERVDGSSIQSEEVWAGITYALSAMMIEKGMDEQAFKTSEGLFESIWHRFPLQYQTPEAITSDGMYRALGYMRPLSIWAIQHALDRRYRE
ncbi:Non-lysosomal glucosylceramidase [Caenorhabditis elegans]|uniref:Non-lysosomal glucosylceramidase n=2 Tax=Caenorhabditis elegans TaxID=6239 RepID=O01893_CAEEL|nr:Non-lysosomal glucosylceramidase [Caenorhabditis elegans]CCD72306.3 Non-lysosomal glucosylceramidase [Caenorhabditis elegans]|eukprot:NP_001317760.1 Non-lysosomal glucosylceramidase [Caenorhabditis elegans]